MGADERTAAPSAGGAAEGRRFVLSAATTYATSLAAAVVSLLNVLITARLLGPTARGDIALLTTIATLTATISNFGVHQAIVNVSGREPHLRRALAGNALVLAAALSAAASVVLGALVLAFPGITGDVAKPLLIFAFAAIPFLMGRVFLQALLQAEYHFAFANGIRLLGPLSGVILNGTLGIVGALSVASAMAAWLAGQVLGTLLLVGFVTRRMAGYGRPSAPLARRSLAFGGQTHVSHVLGIGSWRLDQWIVGALAGSRELGLYSVAVAWAEALFLLPTALATVQRPDLVRAARERAGRQAAAVFRVGALITLPLIVVLMLAAPLLCAGVFGDEFRGSIDDLRVLAPGAIGVIALKLLGDALIAQRRPLPATVATAVGLVCTIVLDVALIPSYGGLGAAIASTAAYSLGGLAAAVVFCRALGQPASALLPRPGDLRGLLAVVRSRFTAR